LFPFMSFYITSGTLHYDAPSYVERRADRDLCQGLVQGEFCYVLTSRQMGKSSLMVRTAKRLRDQGLSVAALDLTAVGQNLSPEQWYNGLVVNLGRQLQLEDELEGFWMRHPWLSPVQRFFAVIRDAALPKLQAKNRSVRAAKAESVKTASGLSKPVEGSQQLVIFIDEIDTVRSLPFSTDEFFAAIRECYNRRVADPEFYRLTFCLLGVASPSELIRDSRTTPFNIGQRIELTDFTDQEAAPLAGGLENLQLPVRDSQLLLDRILFWTGGHPYLTQRMCRACAEANAEESDSRPATRVPQLIDALCEELFLSPRARQRDDNLLFVRERILRSEADLASLLDLYEQVRNGQRIRDDETNDLINHLRLAGIVRVQADHLVVRNRIYHRVFDQDWIQANRPNAELEKSNGERVHIRGTCSLGRAPTNEVVLLDDRVSRRHALIQAQKQNEFWLVDLGSSNGTFLNGHRVTQPALLRDRDQIQLGQFRLTFRQSKAAAPVTEQTTLADKTIHLDN
jgi:hypothetical protein